MKAKLSFCVNVARAVFIFSDSVYIFDSLNV